MGRLPQGNKPTRSERRESQRNHPRGKNKSGYGEVVPFNPDRAVKVTPLNERQQLLISTIIARTLTFATGCAGTGKSHIALAIGVYLLLTKQIDQLVLTKPDFEIDERIGTLPGDPHEKTALLFRAMRDILNKLLGKARLENEERLGKVKFEPLGSILGTTFDRAFMVMDEAQNCTQGQMKAFLSRIGKDSKIVICGDYKEQKFVEGRCGLEDAVYRFYHNPHVGRVDFTPDDIIRSDFCRDVILAYREERKEEPAAQLLEA